METKLDYELWIKGRKADIGSELWYKDEEWIENIFITGIFISNKTRRINYKSKNRTGVIDVETMGDSLFWEKPTIYQLPDTDGNLSEVKIGRHVWLRYNDGCVYKCVIREFSGNNIEIMNVCDSGSVYASNKEGLTFSGGIVTTNKPVLYQLPDTDGNLSEVKIGQHVWVKHNKSDSILEYLISEFDGGNIKIRLNNSHCSTYISNKEGLTRSGGRVTTNKPSRFHGKQDWSQAPKDAIEWRVTVDGYAFWYSNAYCERSGLDYDYDCGMYYISAGYRADLLNENGAVEDWEYSLVKRPKDV